MSEPSYRLLVVDDEPLALNLARRVFETESDIALHSATSAVRALEMAMIHDIDLVITDQRMPEMTGLQFLARVREVRPRALRVLLTAFPDTSVALKAINEGLLYRFILKPWEPEDMRVTVRRALETKRLSDEHDRLVNQLRTSYDELVQSEHMAALGRLSAGIGHELKSAVDSLTAGLGSLELQLGRLLEAGGAAARAIQREFGADEVERLKDAVLRATPDVAGGAEESLAAIRASGAQLEALARGVQSYTAAVEPEPFDINQAVLSAVQLLSHRLRESVRLERNLQAVPLVRCRGPEITQVVLNLLGNAVDAVHRSPEPTIHVRTWHEGASVRLEIADNGAGLDPAIAQRLFKPFTSTQPISRGREVGLSVCKSIVENHGGSIEAAAAGTRGARFTVTLPAIAAV
jgi:C4-dicarboxylate-specific signal transduction histidine kinase